MPLTAPPPMPATGVPPVVSRVVELDDGEDEGREEDHPLFAWLPPEDRLWRHPSEVDDSPTVPSPTVGSDRTTRPATLIRPTAKVWSVALFAGLAGALIASGFFMATGLTERQTTVLEPVVTPGTVALEGASTSGVGDWPAIAGTLASSVVGVRVDNQGNLQVGSGVLYAVGGDESYIITAQDLVAGGGRVTVTFADGDTQAARVVGADAVTGIAVLSTVGDHRNIPTFGSVANMEVAETVLALGARLPNTNPVVTDTISGLDETVTTDTDDSDTIAGMLAMSGATVPQTSNGGALIDPDGTVVGIATDVTSTDPSAQGVASAGPIDGAAPVATQLLRGERPTHPWLGIEDATDLPAPSARQLGVSGGAQVGVVDRDSPAAAIGLRANDVVTAFDGEAVASSGALVTLLSQCQPGVRTRLTFYRQDKRWSATITVAEQLQTDG
jgi:putative serine protease PepD